MKTLCCNGPSSRKRDQRQDLTNMALGQAIFLFTVIGMYLLFKNLFSSLKIIMIKRGEKMR